MKERIRQEIEKTQKRNEEMLKALVPCWTEIEQNRGFILGLKYALMLLEEQESNKTQPCEDAVSRSELLSHDFIITAQNGISHRVIYATRVEEAPPVIPQRKMGRWIFNEKLGHQYCCSECGNPMPTVNDYYRAKLIGCPYCLTDMSGGEKNEDSG